MALPVTLKGAEIKVFVSGKLFPEVQSITYTIDYDIDTIKGIDNVFAQELAINSIKCSGSVQGVRIKDSGGLQGAAAKAAITDSLKHPYTSLRIQNRQTGKDILFLPQMMVNSESFSVAAKGTARFSFNFTGIIPYQENDIS